MSRKKKLAAPPQNNPHRKVIGFKNSTMIKIQKNSTKSAKPHCLTLEEIAASAEFAVATYETRDKQNDDEGPCVANAMSRKAFAGVVDKVVKSSDVVIEVLDIRDPEGCRDAELEDMIIQNGKRLVLLLNKIDLVPTHVVEQWVKYYRVRFPTAVFKAATTTNAHRISHCQADPLKVCETQKAGTNQVLGAEQLVSLLKSYCRSAADAMKSISVGIVGYPNVGKSSVINSLLRSGATKTGGEAGVTRSAQEVKLDKNLTIIDSPGVVLGGNESDPAAVLRGAVKLSLLNDMLPSVQELFRRCPVDMLMRHFSIDEPKDAEEFLAFVAMRRGKLRKQGVPDLQAAGRIVLQEWIQGSIRYYLLPPAEESDEKIVIF